MVFDHIIEVLQENVMKRPVKYKGNGNILVVDGIDYVIPNHVLVWLPEPRESIWIVDNFSEMESEGCFLMLRGTYNTAWIRWLDKRVQTHRENNKPALVSFDKDDCMYWYYNGTPHRTNGPAVVSEFMEIEQYIVHGHPMTKQEYYLHPLVLNDPDIIRNKINTILES